MTVSFKKDCWVKVKKSSPKSLSADCWFSLGWQLADSIPTAHRQLTDSKPTLKKKRMVITVALSIISVCLNWLQVQINYRIISISVRLFLITYSLLRDNKSCLLLGHWLFFYLVVPKRTVFLDKALQYVVVIQWGHFEVFHHFVLTQQNNSNSSRGLLR